VRHRVSFSDAKSTAARSQLARELQLGGVGVWTADAVDAVDYPADAARMWGALLGHT
jgi:spore germination protein YaaH